jgi:hypothetical protein
MMFKLKKVHIGLALGVGALLAVNLASCVSIPKGARAVSTFEKDAVLASSMKQAEGLGYETGKLVWTKQGE